MTAASKPMQEHVDAPLVGRRIAGYQILSQLGAGGMGEVYRARDTRLGGDVAIKLLPPAFAADPERLRRFEREARLLAALNHPHIATVHGFEDADGVRALVLELVEGPTLADRIARGPVPIEEALTIARQMAEALEAAHERGIIHRDLKPANVKLTRDGTVEMRIALAERPSLAQQGGNHRRQNRKPAENGGDDESHGKCCARAQGQKSPRTARQPVWSRGNLAATETAGRNHLIQPFSAENPGFHLACSPQRYVSLKASTVSRAQISDSLLRGGNGVNPSGKPVATNR